MELNIQYYLCSIKFLECCRQFGYERAWQSYVDDIANFYNIPVSSRLDEAKYAFRLLLEGFFLLSDRNKFLKILGDLIIDFKANLISDKDFSKVRKNILDLGYKEDEIAWIFGDRKSAGN
jgi:hypothetical protein